MRDSPGATARHASMSGEPTATAVPIRQVRVCYLDCFSGIAGDMLLGALLDAGLDFEVLRTEIEKLGIDGLAMTSEKVRRGGLAATKVHVKATRDHSHRSLSTIEQIIGNADLDDRIKQDSLRVFRRLGQVEAAAHGIPVERVHFHEVGAFDSIADIVGACAGLRTLGIERVHCSPINLGSGTVRAAHGTMPVPAPATARLVEGVPTYADGPDCELTTPTGAALAVTLSNSFGPPPAMRIRTGGYGAGTRELDGQANVLRVLVGDTDGHEPADSAVWILEAAIDDMTPELAGYAMERLLDAGALDVTLSPIYMKKNRPGFLLTVLTAPHDRSALGELMLTETSTLGIRETQARRRVLPRTWTRVRTRYGSVRVKVAGASDNPTNFAPEYDDCRKLALEHGIPFKAVWEQAKHEFLRNTDD